MNNLILESIRKYHYGAALAELKKDGYEDEDVYIIIKSCKYAVNFDFKTSKELLSKVSEKTKQEKEYKKMYKSLELLLDGDPAEVFQELIENIKFQISNQEYIDFLGRVYRFKEAIFKYVFVRNTIGKRKFSLFTTSMEKREVLKKLRKEFKVYNSNLVYGISSYIDRNLKNDYKAKEVKEILNSERMNALIELRNESIVGHGFKSVSIDDIRDYYIDPYEVLDDFKKCLDILDLKIVKYKYSLINDYIKKLLEEIYGGEDAFKN